MGQGSAGQGSRGQCYGLGCSFSVLRHADQLELINQEPLLQSLPTGLGTLLTAFPRW
jgi:hypothetical protein